MQRTQPNYSAKDLARISVPVLVLHAELDEFIKREDAEYLADNISHCRLQPTHVVHEQDRGDHDYRDCDDNSTQQFADVIKLLS